MNKHEMGLIASACLRKC